MIEPVVAILMLGFVLLLALDVPIAVSIAMATFLGVLAAGYDPGYLVAMKLANGIDSFPLLAIPFFIVSGLLMGQGGIARRLMDFAAALVGRYPGGLAYVNTLTCMLFGSISGSASAAVSSIGGFMLPEMKRAGYPNALNVSVTVTAATTGLIIPPSNIMIVYSVAAGSVSIAGLFLAGVVPGILMGLAIMSVCFLRARSSGLAAGERISGTVLRQSFVTAVPSLMLVVIVMGGILSGLFSATEAAAVAVAYAFALAVVVYREVTLPDLPRILLNAGITTGVIMLLIGSSQGMAWLLITHNVPQEVSAALLPLADNPIVLMLAINLLLLIVGTFMDMTPAVLIFTPIFLPVMQKLAPLIGLNETEAGLHFGIILITNLCIGLCTPPVGSCLFIGCSVGKISVARVTPTLIPFFIAMIIALLAITFIPVLSLWLPEMFGLTK
ncbi:MAG: TRAP transporter large permease [Verrucomicrobiae bacterium]|nr:TRAP transporter large permease [Verrucomicrobiae bacterium]